jgi:hypothetical protein
LKASFGNIAKYFTPDFGEILTRFLMMILAHGKILIHLFALTLAPIVKK